jgi:hypothetical protein
MTNPLGSWAQYYTLFSLLCVQVAHLLSGEMKRIWMQRSSSIWFYQQMLVSSVFISSPCSLMTGEFESSTFCLSHFPLISPASRTGLLGYAAHMLALLTNVIAFSVVIYLWTSIISYKQDVTPSRYILGGFLLLNIGCTLAGVIDLCESLSTSLLLLPSFLPSFPPCFCLLCFSLSF